MAKKQTLAPVFLSAGIPDPRRNPKYINSADMIAIREAVTALTLVVASRGTLIFGGHPAISPLVFLAAKSINATDRVVIYQSEFFRTLIPKESLAFCCLTWTPSTGDRERSLDIMRTKMIQSQKFGFGVFIGGMEGVEEEYDLFVQSNPKATILPIASSGAAAKILFSKGAGPHDPAIREMLRGEYVYSWLFQKLFGLIP